MKDFDAGRSERASVDRGFVIGGEKFKVISGVHPSVLLDYEDAIETMVDRGDLLVQLDRTIHQFLATDDDRKRWDAIRARKDDPITIGDMRAVLSYIYEVETEFPIEAPAPSSIGRARTRRSSEAATSLPAETGS